MATKALEAVHLFPSLGPALMISMGYIDLGKWVAAVEGGARFGFDLVSLVLFFNFAAILCQYLATCIGTVTGKNLAEICNEEYCRLACMLLGVQAEISMITSELTMVLGIAYGLSLLFGVELFACICLATVCTILLPFLVIDWDNVKAELLYIIIAGSALVFYVLGVLISQPEFPLAMDGFFPRLTMESAYSLMALLGANIMVHNFYIHSAVVQQWRRRSNITMGSIFHDHFFAILSIFTGIFLVNYVLMNSAATVFSSPDVLLNFQDVNLLIDQVFRSPIAPAAFLLVLLFSSQITALNWNVGGQVILRYFFGINMSAWVHHGLLKALAIIPALYFARSAGPEGIYQLLIFCQIILAMLLPSSVIPLFRVASSKLIMGAFKIPWYMEILALTAFFAMLASNTIFIIETILGNSNWINNLQVCVGNSVLVLYTILLLVGSISVGLTLYLAVTPLRSANEGPDTQTSTWNVQRDTAMLSEVREFDDLDKVKYDEEQESILEPAVLEKFVEENTDKSTSDNKVEKSETVSDSDHESQKSIHDSGFDNGCASPTFHLGKSKFLVDIEPEENVSKVPVFNFSEEITVQKMESEGPNEKAADVSTSTDVQRDKNIEEDSASQMEDVSQGVPPTPSREVQVSSNTAKGFDTGNGSGSLSKLSGLGRATRRQLSAILDEFWGHLFDFHGKLTQEASTRKFDALMGLDLKIVGASGKTDNTGDDISKVYFPDIDRGLAFQSSSVDYSSPRHKRSQNMESSFGVQVGSLPYSQSVQPLGGHTHNSYTNLFESSERQFSYPSPSSDNRDYQPATIHGYQLASYLRGINAGRTSYSSGISVDLPPSASSFLASRRDPVMFTGENELGSLGTSIFQNQPATSRTSRLPVERSYYEPSLVESGETAASSAYAKKYHSSPDISAVIASIRNSSLIDGNNAPWGSSIGSRSTVGRMTYEPSQYATPVSRAGAPLAFDELSPPKIHRDVFSPYLGLNQDTKSLWSRQPFEQLFGVIGKDQNGRDRGVSERLSRPSVPCSGTFSYTESETKLLQYFNVCMMKLLKLEGSDWLFRQNGGIDEELIDRVAAMEKCLYGADSGELNQTNMLDHQRISGRNEEGDQACQLPRTNCGDGCVWRAALVVSFGVWCIRRILELSVVESRPELWGKYTYVLNRLQGILEPAFLKPREPLVACSCLETTVKGTKNSIASLQNDVSGKPEKTSKQSITTANVVLEMIKDVEAAVSGRKGRTGTAAGDIAFPKGKENLVSVLKRYKRRLSNRSQSQANEGSGSSSRRIPAHASSSVL